MPPFSNLYNGPILFRQYVRIHQQLNFQKNQPDDFPEPPDPPLKSTKQPRNLPRLDPRSNKRRFQNRENNYSKHKKPQRVCSL